jgi:hypothetical protein
MHVPTAFFWMMMVLDGGEHTSSGAEPGSFADRAAFLPPYLRILARRGDWVALPGAEDALRAKLLIMECTFVDDAVTVEDAVAFGHTHINQIIAHAERFQNDAILLTHFSARYKREDIMRNLHARLPPHLLRRVTPLLEGFA